MDKKPKRISIQYEAPELCGEVDDALIAALGSVGYECTDAGAFLSPGEPLEREMEFVPSDTANGERVYLGLYREEVDTLISMTSLSIEIEQEMDEPDDNILSWLHFVRSNLKAALGNGGCDCDEDNPPPPIGD